MESINLKRIKLIDGVIRLPGSKSISNRVLLLAALASGTTEITNLLDSDDTRYMLNALTNLGVLFRLSHNNTRCTVRGLGEAFSTSCPMRLSLGNAGTVMRSLLAILTLSKGSFTLTGEARMKKRPIGHLVDVLRQLGARVDYLEEEGFPPLKVHGGILTGGTVSVNGSVSSQFLTSLLMAAPLARSDTTIDITAGLVSKPYIDITLSIMASFGVVVVNKDYRRFFVKKYRYISPGHFPVEGDASSASYFLAAGAIKGGEVKVEGVGKDSIQGDVLFLRALEKMGAEVEWGSDYMMTRRSNLTAVEMDFNHIPDAAMTIATTALFATGTTLIKNVYNWRTKETDRLSAMAVELRKLGALIEEGSDYISITPPGQIQCATINTYHDHRIAMCFSLAALGETEITINDPECTSKTFPGYFDRFSSISHCEC